MTLFITYAVLGIIGSFIMLYFERKDEISIQVWNGFTILNLLLAIFAGILFGWNLLIIGIILIFDLDNIIEKWMSNIHNGTKWYHKVLSFKIKL